MHKYRVKEGAGMVVVKIDGVRYKGAYKHPTLPEVLELPKPVNHPGLELIEDKKRKE